MPLRQTHTIATLGVSVATFDEIAQKLRIAQYDRAFTTESGKPILIDMTGIGLVREDHQDPSGGDDAVASDLKGSGLPMRLCRQCDVLCLACAMGTVHMNTDPMPDTLRSAIDCAQHNAKGKHHILWNGEENETVLCGSEQCNALAQGEIPRRAREAQITADRRTAANTRQVGGTHYGLGEIQHWDLVIMFGWDYFQSQIIKYVMRHKEKNGVQDLEKAAHFLEKYIESERARAFAERQHD